MSQYSLRLPEDLYNRATDLAKRQGISLNQFFLYAISSTVSGIEAREFFEKRIGGRDEKKMKEQFHSLLDKVSTRPVIDASDSLEEEGA